MVSPGAANVGGRSGSSRRLKFVEVTDAFEPQAEELLRTYSARLISPAQAKQMSGGKYRATKGRPFLVRAVYLNKETGGFSVSLQGRNLFVFHACFSDAPLTMKRQVLIVNLNHAPRNVYRGCTVAA